ncbi:MAG: hypothetical protein ACKVPY_00370 [Paracoccaceae bacterium]
MVVNYALVLDFNDQGYFHLRSARGVPPLGGLYLNDAARILSDIDNLYVSAHGDIKNVPAFQQLYGLAPRTLNFVGNDGQPGTRGMPTYPCHYCGIVLPVDLIEIDHTMPQSAGATGQMAAILKVMHMVDGRLTQGQAQGRKAAAFAQGNFAFIPPKAVRNGGGTGGNFGAPWNSNFPVQGSAKAARYTPTQEGETLLALGFLCFGTGVKGFQHRCMNNFLDLVPACRSCNGSKTNIAFDRQ